MKNLIFKGMILVGSALTLSSFISIEQKIQVSRDCCVDEANFALEEVNYLLETVTGERMTGRDAMELWEDARDNCEKKEDLISNQNPY